MNQDRPALCQGCQDYCGLGRPGDRIVCGIHPYGWSDGGSCPDWRGKGTAPEEESITDEVARQMEEAIFGTFREPTKGISLARPVKPLCPQSVCPVCYHELSEYCSLNCQEPVEPSTYRDFV